MDLLPYVSSGPGIFAPTKLLAIIRMYQIQEDLPTSTNNEPTITCGKRLSA